MIKSCRGARECVSFMYAATYVCSEPAATVYLLISKHMQYTMLAIIASYLFPYLLYNVNYYFQIYV